MARKILAGCQKSDLENPSGPIASPDPILRYGVDPKIQHCGKSRSGNYPAEWPSPRPRECLFTAQSHPESSMKSSKDEACFRQHHRRLTGRLRQCAGSTARRLERKLFVPSASAVVGLTVSSVFCLLYSVFYTTCTVRKAEELLRATRIAMCGVSLDAARGCKRFWIGGKPKWRELFGRVGTATLPPRGPNVPGAEVGPPPGPITRFGKSAPEWIRPGPATQEHHRGQSAHNPNVESFS